MRKITFTPESFSEYNEIARADKVLHRKIITLITDIARNPFQGIGKPEPLKYDFAGCWSRRITQEDRLIYKVTDEEIFIVSCKEHYDDR
jgi:toxin YoeB